MVYHYTKKLSYKETNITESLIESDIKVLLVAPLIRYITMAQKMQSIKLLRATFSVYHKLNYKLPRLQLKRKKLQGGGNNHLSVCIIFVVLCMYYKEIASKGKHKCPLELISRNERYLNSCLLRNLFSTLSHLFTDFCL